MYEAEVMEHFRKVPVFGLADVTQLIDNRNYAKKFLQRMVREGKIKRIMRDSYTLHEDPVLVSTYLVKPSYLSSISALSFHRLTRQIPREVFCFTSKQDKTLDFISPIHYFHTKYLFGFRMEKYEKFSIPVAKPEKAIIDSIGVIPLSVLDEAFEGVETEVLIEYLKRIRKSSIVKRVGYLAERNGFDVHGELKEFINNRYVFLDPLAKKSGERNKKWRLILNG